MTNDEMRIAIAEDRGWQFVKTTGPNGTELAQVIRPDGSLTTKWACAGKGFLGYVPNYPEDLNAMHEVEETLSRGDAIRYRLFLSANSDCMGGDFPTVEAAMCHATATQRAEAYCRVKGLYK